jgi:hypothetical protein
MFDPRPWGPAKPDDVEPSNIVDLIFREWKRTHPEGTVRPFWLAVDAGEVQWSPSQQPHSSPPDSAT